MEQIVVFSTCGSEEEAQLIAKLLIEERLAACVNVVAPVRSYYRWQGAIQNTVEWLLLIKTHQPLLARIEALFKVRHSYELPEILAVPVVGGSAEFLNWVNSELSTSDADQ